MKTPRYTDNVDHLARVDLHKTDLKATFARVRRQQRESESIERARVEQEQREKVAPIRRAKC